MGMSRPWRVAMGSDRERSYETEMAAMGWATVTTMNAPVGTVTIVRNSELAVTWSVAHLEGFVLRARRNGPDDG